MTIQTGFIEFLYINILPKITWTLVSLLIIQSWHNPFSERLTEAEFYRESDVRQTVMITAKDHFRQSEFSTMVQSVT